MKFSLATIAYVFALLAAAMAVFGGGGGILVAAGVLAVWASVFYRSPSFAVTFVVSALVALMLLALLLPAVQTAREAARRSACLGHLKQIGLAIQNFEYATGRLPAASTFDASGKPLHSWRTAVLPYMEQQALYSRLNLAQPWNSPANSPYTSGTQIDLYQCPSHHDSPSTGHYLAVVGEQTAWPPDGGLKFDKGRDASAFTLLVLEAPWKGAAWGEPTDFTFDEAVEFLTREPIAGEEVHEVRRGVFYKASWVVNAAFLDGSVRPLYLPLEREAAAALLTVNGGEEIDETALGAARAAELDYARCYALGAFVALALLPGVRAGWIRWKTRSRDPSDA